VNERDLELLSAYLDDALSPAERAQVEARLATDGEFSAELEALRQTKALVAGLPLLRAPRSFALTHDKLRASRPARRIIDLNRFLTVASAAAAIALVVLGVGALGNAGALQSGQPANQVAAAPTQPADLLYAITATTEAEAQLQRTAEVRVENFGAGAAESVEQMAAPLPAGTTQPDISDRVVPTDQETMEMMGTPGMAPELSSAAGLAADGTDLANVAPETQADVMDTMSMAMEVAPAVAADNAASTMSGAIAQTASPSASMLAQPQPTQARTSTALPSPAPTAQATASPAPTAEVTASPDPAIAAPMMAEEADQKLAEEANRWGVVGLGLLLAALGLATVSVLLYFRSGRG
jgi:anti-sigma factor RsiW